MPGSIQNPSALTVAVDWVYANAGKGSWKHIDKTRIGVWGQSCGGLEAYTAGLNDKRIGHIGIFNSGQLNATTSEEVAGKVEKPIFYLLGGPDDVAYPNVSSYHPDVFERIVAMADRSIIRASETMRICLRAPLLGKLTII